MNSPQPQGSHVGGHHSITGHLWLWAASSVPFPMVSDTDVVSLCVSHTVNKVRKHCYVIRFKAITSESSRGAYIIHPASPVISNNSLNFTLYGPNGQVRSVTAV